MECNYCHKPNREQAVYCRHCGKKIVAANMPQLDLAGLVACDDIKRWFGIRLKNLSNKMFQNQVVSREQLSVFLVGNSGSGKTLVARTLAQSFVQQGLVTGQEVRFLSADEFTQFAKAIDDNMKKLQGGVLIVDHVEKLVPRGKATQLTPLDALYRKLEEPGNRVTAILCADRAEIRPYLEANDEIIPKFFNKRYFELPDYNPEQLLQITIGMLKQRYGINQIDPTCINLMYLYLQDRYKHTRNKPENGYICSDYAEYIKMQVDEHKADTLLPQHVDKHIAPPKTVEEILSELDEFVGMENIKREIRQLVQSLSHTDEAKPRPYHIILTGNPGTGKTTLVDKLARIFVASGLLDNDVPICVRKEDVITTYDKPAAKMREYCEKALGGVLFIDEAYAFGPEEGQPVDPACKEAIESLMQFMEDSKTGTRFVTICAGYRDPMEKRFMKINEGLRSRFTDVYHIEDYTPAELIVILEAILKRDGITLDDDCRERALTYIAYLKKRSGKMFGNAREMRKLAGQIVKRYQARQAGQDGPATAIPEDVQPTFKMPTLDEVMQLFKDYTDMPDITKYVESIYNDALLAYNDHQYPILDHHLAFIGSPGTGKTTVANLMGRIYYMLGYLSTDELHVCKSDDLCSQYVSETAIKTRELVNRALDGVLFIDEAYTLNNNSHGKEAIDALVPCLTEQVGRFVCIIAGYTDPIHELLRTNTGLGSRFKKVIEFRDFTPDRLQAIFQNQVERKGFMLDSQLECELPSYIKDIYDARTKDFGNAREMCNLAGSVISQVNSRIAPLLRQALTGNGPAVTPEQRHTILLEDFLRARGLEKKKTVEEIMAELDELVGMTDIKNYIRRWIETLDTKRLIRKLHPEMQIESEMMNFVITGNPGTGKTTLGRLIGEILYAMQLLPSANLKEVNANNMMAGYVGQTPDLVNNMVDNAMGGVLFIDEAYGLAPQSHTDGYKKEAVDTLITRMLNDKGKLAFVFAGYQQEMEGFINANPGMPRRLPEDLRWHIADYTPDELEEILCRIIGKGSYHLSPEAKTKARTKIEYMVAHKDKRFGNAGDMVNLAKQITDAHVHSLKSLSIEELKDLNRIITIGPDSVPQV